MSGKYDIFDPARVALQRGVNLVEASAGTGKTYAISMLVLRALVDLEVPIEKILIVTFTKAATEELRSRIRARLVEARNLLGEKMEMEENTADQTLLDWVLTIRDRQVALARLQLALSDIDRAAIFTIHGFCQRMLVEQALESGQLFDVELLTDINHIRSQVADDFWRSRIYSLAPLPCSLLTGCFASPEHMLASVSEVFGENGRIEPLSGPIEDVLHKLQTAMESLTCWWPVNSGELHRCLTTGWTGNCFKKQFTEDGQSWFDSLTEFFSEKCFTVPANIQLLSRELLSRELNGNKFRGDPKKEAYLADWPLPDKEIEAFLAAVDSLILTFRVQLAEELRSEVTRRLEQQGTMGFNDLILRLSKTLRGEQGNMLQQIIRERFQVALIDEFQDTDSTQWHIFSNLFGGNDHYLYLIGDPKQAIYKFRGADIDSYFQARQTASRLLTLEKNYRCHPLLVEEVNRLFSSRPNPFFFDETVLTYRPVLPAKKAAEVDLLQGEESLAGMVYCVLERDPEEKNGRWSSGKAASALRRFFVAELGRLLDQANPVFLQTSGQQPLAPHDIAILVRSNRQAEEYRQALAEAGIPAVIGSRQSVFKTDECREMVLLLRAIAAPGETGRLKTALTISWFGLTGYRLHALWQDEEWVSGCHSRFLQYNLRWQEQGFLSMMTGLLAEEEVLPTLASRQMAERTIANILHLLELVQEQENAEHFGVGQILQWLEKMRKGDQSADNAELLLESDEEAVNIVTMHSAKGLEYPVVFCPYLWYASNRLKSEKYQISCHDEAHRLVVDLGSDKFEARREQAAREQMAEELRLLYVALTRAKTRCYVGWADVKPYGSVADSRRSALGYLLFPEGDPDHQAQQEKFATMAKEKSAQCLTVSVDDLPVHYAGNIQRQDLRPLQPSGRSLQTDWQMSSFSALASLSEYDDEYASAVTPENKIAEQSLLPVVGLPAGPNFGNVIHDLLESLSFSAIARQEQQETLSELLKQKCTRYGVDAAADAVQKLLELVVATPLSENSFCLSVLDDALCLKEMGFYFHLSRLATDRINALLADEPTVAPLSHRVMRGYLTGFVDLICEYGGKYYILDYKTNFLGELLDDYTSEKLVEAMQSHNYGLQYWIYTLVLHRHLQNLLPDYSYEEHFGGVRYLFVRGMCPEFPGSGVYATIPDYHKLLELDRIIGGVEND